MHIYVHINSAVALTKGTSKHQSASGHSLMVLAEMVELMAVTFLMH